MLYAETVGLCPSCARDCHAGYHERVDGTWLVTDCPEHGPSDQKVENDSGFFRLGYEHDYVKAVDHLAMPLTYRCNLNCKYCYSMSNSDCDLPPDRTQAEMALSLRDFSGNITFIGGEPTLRGDLMHLIELAKSLGGRRRVSIATNGQKLREPDYVRQLKAHGLDFVFLSLNDPAYDGSPRIRENKLRALENCLALGLPVWLQQTIDKLDQLDSTMELLRTQGRNVFRVTIRAARPIGVRHPDSDIFISDMLEYLGQEGESQPGTSPFNRYIMLHDKSTKLCSWVNDMTRLDPIDSRYLVSDGTLTTFHRGIKLDEVLLKALSC